MMGYTQADIEKMIDTIYTAIDYAKDVEDDVIVGDLMDIADLLDGLLVEGRI